MSALDLLPNEITRPCFPWRQDRCLLSYGLPFPELVEAHVNRLHSSRVFAVVSGSLARNTNHLERLEEALGGKLVGKHVGFPSHVPWDEILKLVQEVSDLQEVLAVPQLCDSQKDANQERECNADLIVTLGGGSITDAVKLTALCLENKRVKDYEALENLSQTLVQTLTQDVDFAVSIDPPEVRPAKISMINIPTTLSCGEYSPYAGGIDPRDGIKKLFMHKSMTANVVILDPDLGLSVPEWVWMSTGVRSIDHAVATLSSLRVNNEQMQKSAQTGLRLLVRGLLKLRKDPNDRQSRLDTQLGSVYASDGLARGIHFGASHAIGHQLGTMNVAHGHTSCILMPATSKYNARVNADRQMLALDAIWSDTYIAEVLSGHGLLTTTSDLGDTLDCLFREFGMPRSLKDVGIEGEEKLHILAKRSLTDIWCVSNPVPLTTEAQVIEILRMVEV